MTAPASSARHEFSREVNRSDGEIDLARAALLVAKEAYPQLAVDPYLIRLDALAEQSLDRLGGETAPLVVLRETLGNLFGKGKLKGNEQAYYDARNSFLNDVLDRKLGIPLTLGIVLLEVGWRLGLKVEGVDFPMHFLVRFRGDALSLLIDPFYGGKIHRQNEAQEMLERYLGPGATLKERHMKTATKRDMVVRLLLNLKKIYLRTEDYAQALTAVERILVVRPTAREQIRDRGYLLARLGRREEAVAQLEAYLVFAPGAGDVGKVETLVRRIRETGSGTPPLGLP